MTKFDEELGMAEFVLFEDDEYRIIFHFFTRDSHCHSFNDEPPKNWNEVYKVYYSWSITGELFYEDGTPMDSDVLFDIPWDECSGLTDIPSAIRKINKRDETGIILNPLGQPASEWSIHRINDDTLWFTVWNDPLNVGYRFKLSNEKAEEFAQFLDSVNQYMLEHGEGI